MLYFSRMSFSHFFFAFARVCTSNNFCLVVFGVFLKILNASCYLWPMGRKCATDDFISYQENVANACAIRGKRKLKHAFVHADI